MFSQIGKIILQQRIIQSATNFNFGLEVEMDRALDNGQLSNAPYPKGIGKSNQNPWITNDFLEVMTETVTPPAKNAITALHYLYQINTTLRRALAPNEILWPLSMPPAFPKDRGKHLVSNPSPYKHKFFQDWVDKHSFYGGTPCGIHINISIDDHIIDLIAKNLLDRFQSRAAVQTHLYLKIGQGFFRYRWLITYLFGASPITEANYFEDADHPHHPVRSLRQSAKFGYGVTFTADFTNLNTYVDTLKQAFQDKVLLIQTEGHGPVRFRGNKDLDKMKQEGIKYVEMRMLDLDPDTPVGIRTTTLRFFKLLTIYFMMTPPIQANQVNDILQKASEMNNIVSLERPDHCTYHDQIKQILDQLQKFINLTELGPEYQEVIQEMKARLENPQLTPSDQLTHKIKNNSLIEYAVQQGKRYQANANQALYPFIGFQDHPAISAEELRNELEHLNVNSDHPSK